jgi:hypothetical protein
MQRCVRLFILDIDARHFVLKQHFSNLKVTPNNCSKEGCVAGFGPDVEYFLKQAGINCLVN